VKATNNKAFSDLAVLLDGELLFDNATRAMYATDASVYKIVPQAVAFPKNAADIQKLLTYANQNNLGLIPRSAGTSLAGQSVGEGIVVDVSKYMTAIYHIDPVAKTAIVAPGVIRDDLNRLLKPHGLFFGPNTSTSNRCMIGGMVGNNSSGTTSIKYGVTRDKVIEMEVVLANGEVVTFGEVDANTFLAKAKENTPEGIIYKHIYELLQDESVRHNITEQFPKPEIHRRNTGYAIDELIKSEVFIAGGNKFNLCKLLCGSEGTLAFTTKIKLQLDDLPPPATVLVAAHFDSIENCMKAVVPVMQHGLYSCEMMDKVVLDCTKNNLMYKDYRFFIEADPEAILLLEVKSDTIQESLHKAQELCSQLKNSGLSYAFPVLQGDDIDKAMELRKAGLGLLGNMVGDRKAVACIEDTAVALVDLADYISEFTELMRYYDQKAVYYAHAGAGELHLRPILNLKKEEDVKLFKEITTAVAHLVKKYKGSMSGEHGDGIVRSSFIEMMIGTENFAILKEIKHLFDPLGIMNPGKIVDAYSMTENLRYVPERKEPEVNTLMDFSESQGILRAVEKCNGSGDCRKPEASGGTMCPSYRVTKNEKDTTRGRANVLREFLTNSEKINRFDHNEIKEVLDLCVSCKGCKSECPSNVDMAAFKAEFEYQYQKENGSSLRTKLFARFDTYQKKGSRVKPLTNFLLSNALTSGLIKKGIGIASKRSLPSISTVNLYKEYLNIKNQFNNNQKIVYFFIDEFTLYNDARIGAEALELLFRLGYQVEWVQHSASGRALISKGFLDEAKVCANENIATFKNIINADTSLIGLEPSAILTFRDEYLRLADDKEAALQVSENVFTIDEFLASEIKKGNITKEQFTSASKIIKLHLHCHQKALSSVIHTFDILNLPENYKVTVIPSGCCGMAGSFGYEAEHYDISMQMGELTLLPAVRKSSEDVLIAATGTSCRHQIKDGTDREALHPVSILLKAIN
jgi:FAD/FMN-containing dehydrogenase/Fe-S oxidoreductase